MSPTSSGGWRAHPRACGENFETFKSAIETAGSSPRVRGKPVPPQGMGQEPGLIPARAGKTFPRRTGRTASSAHPRACGENSDDATTALYRAGSSPRVRGKPILMCSPQRNLGLIPARAGKTIHCGTTGPRAAAHPRACGENEACADPLASVAGSSPRVRGKREAGSNAPRRPRLIPARAGKTGRGKLGHRPAPGSSPRVRGKQRGALDGGQGVGLIPARAGKTAYAFVAYLWRRAHPRACGENCGSAHFCSLAAGSSPRVRGKRDSAQRRGGPRGLIPARAGKTTVEIVNMSRRWAHPRACGENPRRRRAAPSRAGSSPRVRGKP